MGVASELAVKFTADTSGLEAGGQKAEGLIGRMTSGFGKMGVVAAAGIGAGAAALGAFAYKAIQAGSDIAESQNKVNVVFGDSATAINDLAATAASQLGMTKAEVLSAAGGVGNLLTAMGASKDAAASMSVDMVKLATDLGSFNNASSTEVLEAMTAAMAGETDGMKKYGVAINEATLKQAAMDAGLGSNVQALSASEKQMLALKIMTEQTASAHGDFANTSDGMANSMKIVKASIGDMAGEIGGKLLPIITPLVSAFADWLPGALAVVVSAGDKLIGWIQAAAGYFASFFTSTSQGGATFRDQIMDVWNKIKAAVGAVVDWFNANVKPILVAVFETVAAKVAELKAEFDQHFGGIRGAVQAVVDWFNTNVAPTLSKVFDDVMAVVGPVVAFIRDHMDQIKAIVGGALDVVIGTVKVAFNLIKGVFEVVMAAIRGDWGGAWEAIKKTVANIVPGIKQVIGGMFDYLKGLGTIALDALIKVGENLIEGLKSGARSAWTSFLGWFNGIIDLLPATVKKILGIHSPSTVFAGIGENVVEGLKEGMSGLAELAGIINETLGRIIGDADRENFKSIAELTGSLLDIFTNTTKAIRALLDFDITTSAAQISAQFDALVGTFQTALLRMKGLAQYAGRGDSPLDFLNMFDVQNIEIVSKGFDATIGLINGVLDIAAKLQTVKVPNAADIEALFEPLSKLGNVAARFIESVGTPEGEDATAYFNQGATTAAALASWAKSIADIVGIKFGAVSAEFEAQMNAAADASVKAWNAVKVMADEWGGKGVSEREKLLTGIQAYATAVGAAVGILKGVAELKIDVATLATRDQMNAAAGASANALAALAANAKWWTDNAEAAAKIVAGIKAYAEASGAAVSLLKSAGELAFDKVTVATWQQLSDAATNAQRSEILLRGLADLYITQGAEWREKVVPAMKDYADSAGAALRLLADAAGIASEWAASSVIPADMLTVAAINAERARIVVQQLAERWRGAADADGMAAVVAAVKDWTDTAGAALKALADAASIAAGFQESGVIPIQSLIFAAINATRAREVVQRLAEEWAKGKDDKAMAGTAAAIKAWGDVSGSALKALADAADGIAKLSDKLSIPSDLGDKVAQLVAAMRIVVGGMAEALTGPGALSADVAKAGADVAEAVGRIGDAFGPIFDAINAAIESPFGRIKATGQRGDTFRQNIANRIKASLVAAVTALSEALGSMPTITIPDGLSEQIDKLAGIYDRILDVIGKLDGVKIDTRAVASLAAALGVLAGGVGGVGPGNISVTGGGSQLSVASGPGGGIVINNEFNPTLTPLPITINTTNNISVSGKVVESIATEVQRLEELKLRQGGTP